MVSQPVSASTRTRWATSSTGASLTEASSGVDSSETASVEVVEVVESAAVDLPFDFLSFLPALPALAGLPLLVVVALLAPPQEMVSFFEMSQLHLPFLHLHLTVSFDGSLLPSAQVKLHCLALH